MGVGRKNLEHAPAPVRPTTWAHQTQDPCGVTPPSPCPLTWVEHLSLEASSGQGHKLCPGKWALPRATHWPSSGRAAPAVRGSGDEGDVSVLRSLTL